MNNKYVKYYDVQEMFDEVTYQIKEDVQKELEDTNKKENALQIIKDLFPNSDAQVLLDSIELKMQTFKAIAEQYKTDIEGDSRYKDVLLIAMGGILNELQPYEIILHYMYPHMTPFFHSLHIWYSHHMTDCSATAAKA